MERVNVDAVQRPAARAQLRHEDAASVTDLEQVATAPLSQQRNREAKTDSVYESEQGVMVPAGAIPGAGFNQCFGW